MKDGRILLLCTLFLFSGMELAFWTGEFPQLLRTKSLGLVLSFAGIGEVVGGFGIGRLSDTIGRTPTLLLGAVMFFAALVLTCVLRKNGDVKPAMAHEPYFAYIAALLYGLSDSVFNTQSFALLGQLFPDELGDNTSPQEPAHDAATGAAGSLQHTTASPLLDAMDADQKVSVSAGAGAGAGAGAVAVTSAASGDGDEPAAGSGESFTAYLFMQNIGSAIGYFGAIPIPLKKSLAQVWVLGALLAVGSVLYAVADPSFCVNCRRRRQASRAAA